MTSKNPTSRDFSRVTVDGSEVEDREIDRQRDRIVLLEYDCRGALRVRERVGDSESPWTSVELARHQNESDLSAPAIFARVLTECVERFPDHWVIWRAAGVDAEPLAEKVIESLVAKPRNLSELWHCGLEAPVRQAVSSLGYVDVDDVSLCGAETGALREGTASKTSQSWLVAAELGVAHCSVFATVLWGVDSESFVVNWIDFGRRASRSGCICWQDAGLLSAVGSVRSRGPHALQVQPIGPAQLQPLIEQCYGSRWVVFWALSRTLFGPARWGAFTTLISESVKRLGNRSTLENRGRLAREADSSLPHSSPELVLQGATMGRNKSSPSVSVVVPSLGRPESLRHLLLDLQSQGQAVKEVVVVEQRPGDAKPYDGEIYDDMKFKVVHLVVDWIGAGRARNLAIAHSTGELVLFLDDDLGLPTDFVATLSAELERWQADALSSKVVTPAAATLEEFAHQGRNYRDHRRLLEELQIDFDREGEGDTARGVTAARTDFAGGASLVRLRDLLAVDGFDERLDFGYGEDFELGVRLRQAGANVLVTGNAWVAHLHAPVGGFRALENLNWEGGEEPKPSPYVLLSRAGLSLPMQRSYVLIYLLRCLLQGAWRSPMSLWRVQRRLRLSFEWVKKIERRDRGGIRQHEVRMNASEQTP